MWQPTASINNLQRRAEILRAIREFFYQRQVLEVETPVLGKATIPDPTILSIPAEFTPLGSKNSESCYLQTSPEFFMKRLLAAGSGSIYQISKAFRDGEAGRLHNPEFTLLEWYRVGWEFHELMVEVDELLQALLNSQPADSISYQNIFLNYLAIDPLVADMDQLQQCAQQQGITIESDLTRDDWLNLLFSHYIEPKIGLEKPLFVYHYPASQAALAKLSQQDSRVAERFEFFYRGYELANGFGELGDFSEQRQRFEAELELRTKKGLQQVPLDEKFLASLEADFPFCSGVAMGVDRLVMLALNVNTIAEGLAFDFDCC